jgi:hypothetical protein
VVVAFVGAFEGVSPFTPPYEAKNFMIYATATGSDVTGNGKTFATAYRTYQRAVLDVPSATIIPTGHRYYINITDLGDEILPPSYGLPAWKGGGSTGPEPVEAGIVFFAGSVNTFADLKLAGTVARARITNMQIDSITVNPENELTEVVLTAAATTAKAWADDEWKGRFMWTGNPFDSAPIYGNDKVNAGTQSRLLVAGFFAPGGGPLDISEPSAVLTGGDENGTLGLNKTDNGNHFSGVAIRNSVPGDPGVYGLAGGGETDSGDQASLKTNLCELDVASNISGFWSWGSIVRDSGGFDRNIVMFSSYLVRCNFRPLPLVQIIGTAVEEMSLFAPQPGFALYIALQSFNSPGHGIEFAGGYAILASVRIDGAAGDGISALTGQGYISLENVHGTVLGDLGVRAAGGVQIEAIADVDITGAADDLKSGDLADTTWASLPQYDITAVGAGGATGTGSRIFGTP